MLVLEHDARFLLRNADFEVRVLAEKTGPALGTARGGGGRRIRARVLVEVVEFRGGKRGNCG